MFQKIPKNRCINVIWKKKPVTDEIQERVETMVLPYLKQNGIQHTPVVDRLANL